MMKIGKLCRMIDTYQVIAARGHHSQGERRPEHQEDGRQHHMRHLLQLGQRWQWGGSPPSSLNTGGVAVILQKDN